MRKLTLACGLVLAASSGFAPGLTGHFGSSGVRYVAVASAQAAEGDADKPAGEAPAGEAKEATPEQLAEAAYVALEKNCASCHGAGKRLNRAAAVDRASHQKMIEEQKVVVPGKPDESSLYTLMLDKEKPMPPARVPQKPTPEEIEAIRLWIEKGAPAPVPVAEQPKG